MTKRRLRGHDLRQVRDCHGLIGVDEAGRGALAGPVVAGTVLVNRTFLDSDWCQRHAPTINDSKQLSPEQRARAYERMEWLMREHRIIFAAGIASVAEIESENILGATRLAMRRAIEAALALAQIQPHPPDPLFALHEPVTLAAGQCITDWKLLIDGRPMRGLGFAHRAIVEGDGKSLAIAMASIVAKVTRDRLMEALDVEVGGYGFARHKGYATPAHRESLLALGASAHHRTLFVRTFLDRGEDPAQELFEFAEDGESARDDATTMVASTVSAETEAEFTDADDDADGEISAPPSSREDSVAAQDSVLPSPDEVDQVRATEPQIEVNRRLNATMRSR